ncbi:MAG TPA: hypothetical protein ENH10_05585, partial [Bacteroidetes bacterium]|nr:hypothetical protein [Bacteroidota bacterium]HEX04616.1 hypothetical protein [Bacteroidota bacterium]
MRFINALLIVGLLLTLVTSGQAFEKTVLVEYFTNVNCGPCAGQHDPIENMLNTYTRDEITYICYHTSWPSSQDGYYVGNISENSGRWNYYGVTYVPWFQIEGLWGDSSSLNAILPNGVARIGTYTPYQIEFNEWPEPGATVPITATVTCAEPTNPNMRFNIVLIDKEMVIPPGSNGVDDYKYNMLDMAYSYTGQAFTSTGGNEELVFNYTFDIPGNNTFGNLAVVAFVQDYSTKEIYQSAFIAGPEVIIHGTIEHAVTGVPMWMAVVQLNGGNDGQDITGQDGNYHFSGLVEGDYALDVFLAGYDGTSTPSTFFEYGTHEVNLEMINEHENMAMMSGAGADNDVHDAFEVGNYAYIAAGLDGLYIYDISDFSNIVQLSSLNVGAEVMDVIVVGDYAFVGTTAGVTSINVSDPSNPSVASSVTTASRVFSVDVSGSYVYGAGASAGLVVVNISNPNALNLVTEFDTPGYARDVAVTGNFAFVADGVSGLTVVNISTPGTPVVAGDYNTPGYANGVALEGTTAYVADDQLGVSIINVANPNNPQLISDFDCN